MDGVGPEYCKACAIKHKVRTQCKDCPRPTLLPENVAAVNAYLSLQTQCRYSHGVYMGLDYTRVESYLRMNGYKGIKLKMIFEQLQTMEFANLGALDEMCKAQAEQENPSQQSPE